MKTYIFYTLIILLVWFMIHSTIIVLDGLKDNIENVDTAVVLGNKIESAGNPSDRLKSRLDCALQLYKEGCFKYIIVSGAIEKEGFDEAREMRGYLIRNGVPSDIIIIDNNGINTLETAKNTKAIMDQMGLKGVMIISQYYHITRSKLAFSKIGLSDVTHAHARYFELRDLYSVFREFFAFYKYLIL